MTVETAAIHALSFVAAPLLLGVINKTKAMAGGRTGAPLLQPYYDLWKLLQKGAVYSRTTTWLFRAGPMVGLAAVIAAVLVTPAGRAPALLAFPGDLLLFIGLLGLGRFATVLAALDTGSSFEGMGASREVTFSGIAEPALFLALLVLVLVTGGLSLTDIAERLGPGLWLGANGLALALATVTLFLVLLAENARIPVDDPNTHLELTMVHEVMVLDHSGPDFAYILYGAALKLWVFGSLLVGLVFPLETSNVLGNIGIHLAGMAALGVVIGVVESSMARIRLVQVPQLLLSASGFGALGLALALVVR
jgi:formate hydrogenlyase subunit 4